MTPTFFFSPAKPHKVIWGAGPVFVVPTATSKVLGQGKLSMGPSFVALVQPGHWTIGALVNNVWSVAGSGGRPAVNQMTLQYFVNYNLKKGWYLTSQPILTANWKATSGNVWVVPFGGGLGRIMKLGFQPVNLSAQFYGNAAYPTHGSPWGMRLQIAFLFPRLNEAEEKALLEKRLKERSLLRSSDVSLMRFSINNLAIASRFPAGARGTFERHHRHRLKAEWRNTSVPPAEESIPLTLTAN